MRSHFDMVTLLCFSRNITLIEVSPSRAWENLQARAFLRTKLAQVEEVMGSNSHGNKKVQLLLAEVRLKC